jgi:hypothetical protein
MIDKKRENTHTKNNNKNKKIKILKLDPFTKKVNGL